MKKRILILAAVVVAVLLVAGPVAAKATVTEFTGIEIPGPLIDEGTVTFPGGNIHVRGMVAVNEFVADDPRMTGVGTVYANANWDADWVGPLWGTWSMITAVEGGFWEGTFTGMFHANGSTSFRCVGQGTGVLKGQKTMFTLEYAPGASEGQASGRILDPHGE